MQLQMGEPAGSGMRDGVCDWQGTMFGMFGVGVEGMMSVLQWSQSKLIVILVNFICPSPLRHTCKLIFQSICFSVTT